ncbi:MAG TPA: FAD-dependent oxidoreductase, partial [Vicinamibacterales bacterium]|nr:FAD-dependent oxidoreductase [Vicinamibacterales bacterium]
MQSHLTRRTFLERLGMVGGYSLVMAALQSWDLMAGQAGTRPSLSGRPERRKVVVLGAGISGLVLGYELGRLGYDFRILEARDRVGGLNWTVRRGTTHTEIGGETQVCTFDDGLYANVGPWRIPYTHTGVLNYCREFGVRLEAFANYAEGNYCYYEGEAAGPLAKQRIRRRQVKADLAGHVNELLVKAIDQHALDLALSPEDQKRLVDFLVQDGYLDATDHTYKAFAIRGPGEPYALSDIIRPDFTRGIRSIIPAGDVATLTMFQPVGGMEEFAKGFQRAIDPSRITFNAEVQSVRQDDAGVKVVYMDTRKGHRKELKADYVVLCLPMTIIAKLDVNLSPEIMTAVRAIRHSDSAKMGLAMRRRFWEEDDQIFGGHLYSDLPIGEFSYPSNDYFTKNGVLLGLYANGPIGTLEEQPVAARLEHVLTHASKVHPQMRQEFESAYAVWWRRVKYSEGGYATGSAAARRGQTAKLDNRLLIGSAATAPHSQPDWQEGAISAAWQALTTIHERAMR